MSILLIVIVVLVLGLLLYGILTYNGLVKLNVRVEEAWSDITVQLKRRADLIPNLVETVKGYAKHESETLEKVIAARNATADAASLEARAESENVLSGALRQLFALSEAYPDLKANTNFMDLQGQLKRIEEDIANARKFYNAVVKEYNNLCMMIPSSIIASLAHFSAKSMFAVDDAAERQNVKVEF